jgi:hypothetical protein
MIRSVDFAQQLEAPLAKEWRESVHALGAFLEPLGVTSDVYSRALYIFPVTGDSSDFVNSLASNVDPNENWALFRGRTGKGEITLAFPVSPMAETPPSLLSLYIEVHSRLVEWWLVSALRAQQLALATTQLANASQFIAAAACARSLLETSAVAWVEATAMREEWQKAKNACAEKGPQIDHWHSMVRIIWKMQWAGKFELNHPMGPLTHDQLSRTNIMTQLKKLLRVSPSNLDADYQWLCNAVHPSIGGMLSFASPMMAHAMKSCAFQWISGAPTHFREDGGSALVDVSDGASWEVWRESTIQIAIARAFAFSVFALSRTLDDALRTIDDIALTTEAPSRASFDYWRNLRRGEGASPCPCRSGKSAAACLHAWTDPTPSIVSTFL